MEKLSLVNILNATNLLKYLDEQAVLFILEHGQIVTCSDNDMILTQGKMGNGLYIVLQGNMQVTIKLLGKGTLHLATLTPGSFFGEVSFLENHPCTATIRSLGESYCFLFKKESFDQLYLAFPDIRHHITRALIEEVIIREGLMVDAIKQHTKNFRQPKINLNIFKPQADPGIKENISKKELQTFFENFKLDDLPLTYPNPWIQYKLQFPDNHRIIEQKQRGQSCFYILKGAVMAGIMTTSGFLKFAVIGPQCLICSTSMLNNEPELFVYKTIGTTTVLEISPTNIEQFKQKYPLAWYHFYDILVRHVISLQKKLNGKILLIESVQKEEPNV